MWTQAFDAFVAPARARPQLWRLLLGLIVIGLCWAGTTLGAFALLGVASGLTGTDFGLLRAELAAGDSPLLTLILLFTFAGLFGGTILAARIHGRRPGSLIGRDQFRPFLMGLAVVFAVTLLGGLVPSSLDIVPNLEPSRFLVFLLPALLALLLQTGAEEVAFRGYLQTQLAARFRSPVLWLFLPGLLFGAMHWNPAEFGPNAPHVVAATTLVGWLAADLTRVSGGIGAAWGLHFANNAGGILAVGTPGPLGGLAAFRHLTPGDDPALGPLMLVQIGFLVLAWLILRLWLARRSRTATG